MSLSIALSGVQAAQTDIDTIGNNIANVSTAGFKESNAQFADVYSGARSSLGGIDQPRAGRQYRGHAAILHRRHGAADRQCARCRDQRQRVFSAADRQRHRLYPRRAVSSRQQWQSRDDQWRAGAGLYRDRRHQHQRERRDAADPGDHGQYSGDADIECGLGGEPAVHRYRDRPDDHPVRSDEPGEL